MKIESPSDVELAFQIAEASMQRFGSVRPPWGLPPDMMLALARQSLERYGSVLPPPLESESDSPKALAAESDETDWKEVQKTCPKCGRVKFVLPDFGVVNKRGVIRPQPWCKSCRATTNYHSVPRKNRTKHNP